MICAAFESILVAEDNEKENLNEYKPIYKPCCLQLCL